MKISANKAQPKQHSLDTGKQGEITVLESNEKKESKIRLTSSQLYDLYARLDINGDGELDMSEFMAVGRKLDFDNENIIVRAFKFADTSASGKLDAGEFLAAYEAMFNGDIDDDGDSGEDNFVRCTRYGIDKSSNPPRILFQTYTGTLMALKKVADYSDGETKSRQLNEQEWKLNRIVDLMIVDGQNNLDNGSNILWWVDICVAEVLPKIVSNIIRTFGLPPDIDTCFYTDVPTPERESRIRKGTGKVIKSYATTAKNKGLPLNVESLSMFVQSVFLKNLPIVHEYGTWVDHLVPKLIKKYVIYISSRISMWYKFSNTPDDARNWSLVNAERCASNFTVVGKDIERIESDEILTSSLRMPEVRGPPVREAQAEFLLSRQDLLDRNPVLVFENLSVHLLKIGNQTANNLLTFRKLDSEADVTHTSMKGNLEIEQKSKGGIIGRLIWGGFQQLYNVVRAGGADPTHGEMMDSSAYLAIVLISLVHNFNMDIIGSIEYWMDKIEMDMNEIAVGKHMFHLRECEKVCREVDSYIRTFHTIVDDMVLEDPDAEPVKITSGMLRRQKIAPHVVKESETKTVEDTKHFELSPSTMKPFYGEIGLRTLSYLIDGNVNFEVKGSSFWCSQMDRFFERAMTLSDLYDQKLDEKRNFWSFILTIVSIAQFPLAAMSAYWCMHVDNMIERDVDWWDEVPGYNFFWFCNCVAYVMMCISFIHLRIIYAAS